MSRRPREAAGSTSSLQPLGRGDQCVAAFLPLGLQAGEQRG